MALFRAVATDVGRDRFRGCAFNNASIELDDPDPPARIAAREYRTSLLERIRSLIGQLAPPDGADRLAAHLALVIDGMYTNAAHLGPDGPAAHGEALARQLVAAVRGTFS